MGATPHIYAASIGIQDSIFLMFLALIVFGPRRLPEIGRQIGKLMYEFRKVSNDFKFQMEEELRAAEEADRQKKLQAALPPPAPAADPEPPTPAAVEIPAAETPIVEANAPETQTSV
ncbi:MAG TPA: twin-arginine translocase TatA/TatE family subunit, partial [Acidobacteriaceae bacterium]